MNLTLRDILVTLEVGAFIVCFSKSIDRKCFDSGICYITLQQLYIDSHSALFMYHITV